MTVIDIHAHAFPDSVAKRAVPALEEEGNIKACLDGTVSSLLDSMDRAGIDVSVVASISTKPSQFRAILEWSQQIVSDRIIPFPSVHPDDPDSIDQIGEIAKSGFRGIKLHPYYQGFAIDEERMYPVYDRVQREGLSLLVHTGFDLAYPRDRIADPKRVATVTRDFPELKFIASHFGAWEDWDEVEKHLLGKPVYIDTSYSIPQLGAERAKRMLEQHDHDYFLFGSDSPWGDQCAELEMLKEMNLDDAYAARLFGGNAAALLSLR